MPKQTVATDPNTCSAHGHRGRRAWLAGAGAWISAACLCKPFAAKADEASDLNVPHMPYAAFDRLPSQTTAVGGAHLRIAFGPGEFALPQKRIVEYVTQSARSTTAYFGRFPARDTRVLILNTSQPGRPVRGGAAFAFRGAAIKLTLSAQVSEAALLDDWVLVHEMCHLALPSLPRRHHWFEEGMASYVEPFARAQAGVLAATRVWSDLHKGLPAGLPQPGDRGLDNTPTWGRTYWGGALFCLLADVEMRERTGNTKGLQHALRAILAHGNMEQDSALEPLLDIGDQAVGVPVLAGLYARMKNAPHPVDLGELWGRLGVRAGAAGVSLDDSAPLAAVRRALTQALKA